MESALPPGMSAVSAANLEELPVSSSHNSNGSTSFAISGWSPGLPVAQALSQAYLDAKMATASYASIQPGALFSPCQSMQSDSDTDSDNPASLDILMPRLLQQHPLLDVSSPLRSPSVNAAAHLESGVHNMLLSRTNLVSTPQSTAHHFSLCQGTGQLSRVGLLPTNMATSSPFTQASPSDAQQVSLDVVDYQSAVIEAYSQHLKRVERRLLALMQESCWRDGAYQELLLTLQHDPKYDLPYVFRSLSGPSDHPHSWSSPASSHTSAGTADCIPWRSCSVVNPNSTQATDTSTIRRINTAPAAAAALDILRRTAVSACVTVPTADTSGSKVSASLVQAEELQHNQYLAPQESILTELPVHLPPSALSASTEQPLQDLCQHVQCLKALLSSEQQLRAGLHQQHAADRLRWAQEKARLKYQVNRLHVLAIQQRVHSHQAATRRLHSVTAQRDMWRARAEQLVALCDGLASELERLAGSAGHTADVLSHRRRSDSTAAGHQLENPADLSLSSQGALLLNESSTALSCAHLPVPAAEHSATVAAAAAAGGHVAALTLTRTSVCHPVAATLFCANEYAAGGHSSCAVTDNPAGHSQQTHCSSKAMAETGSPVRHTSEQLQSLTSPDGASLAAALSSHASQLLGRSGADTSLPSSMPYIRVHLEVWEPSQTTSNCTHSARLEDGFAATPACNTSWGMNNQSAELGRACCTPTQPTKYGLVNKTHNQSSVSTHPADGSLPGPLNPFESGPGLENDLWQQWTALLQEHQVLAAQCQHLLTLCSQLIDTHSAAAISQPADLTARKLQKAADTLQKLQAESAVSLAADGTPLRAAEFAASLAASLTNTPHERSRTTPHHPCPDAVASISLAHHGMATPRPADSPPSHAAVMRALGADVYHNSPVILDALALETAATIGRTISAAQVSPCSTAFNHHLAATHSQSVHQQPPPTPISNMPSPNAPAQQRITQFEAQSSQHSTGQRGSPAKAQAMALLSSVLSPRPQHSPSNMSMEEGDAFVADHADDEDYWHHVPPEVLGEMVAFLKEQLELANFEILDLSNRVDQLSSRQSRLHITVVARDRELERLALSESDTLSALIELKGQLEVEQAARRRLAAQCEELQSRLLNTMQSMPSLSIHSSPGSNPPQSASASNGLRHNSISPITAASGTVSYTVSRPHSDGMAAVRYQPQRSPSPSPRANATRLSNLYLRQSDPEFQRAERHVQARSSSFHSLLALTAGSRTRRAWPTRASAEMPRGIDDATFAVVRDIHEHGTQTVHAIKNVTMHADAMHDMVPDHVAAGELSCLNRNGAQEIVPGTSTLQPGTP